MTADPMRSKALAVLREGRCSVVNAECYQDSYDLHRVEAHVRSSRPERPHPYVVDFTAGIRQPWTCTCRDGMRGESCAHVAAVMLVTVGNAA